MEKTNLETAATQRLALRNLLLTLTTVDQVVEAAAVVDAFPDHDQTAALAEVTQRLSLTPAVSLPGGRKKRSVVPYSTIEPKLLKYEQFRALARLISVLIEPWQIAAAICVKGAFLESALRVPIQDALKTLSDANVTNVITPVSGGYTVTVTLGSHPVESSGQFGIRTL